MKFIKRSAMYTEKHILDQDLYNSAKNGFAMTSLGGKKQFME